MQAGRQDLIMSSSSLIAPWYNAGLSRREGAFPLDGEDDSSAIEAGKGSSQSHSRVGQLLL